MDHKKLWKILKEMGISDQLIFLLKNLYTGQETIARAGHGTTYWFNGSKLGKDYIKAVYCHFIYLTLCRVRHVKCRAGRITRWNQDCQEKEQ